jgi:hypothetical protein
MLYKGIKTIAVYVWLHKDLVNKTNEETVKEMWAQISFLQQ